MKTDFHTFFTASSSHSRIFGIAARGRSSLSWAGLLCGLIWILAALVPNAGAAVSVDLEWDPNSEADVAGYKLYYGTASGTYTETVDVGNTTTATAANLIPGTTYFFAVTAYNLEGLESLTSNEILVSPLGNAPTLSTIAGQTIAEDSGTGALPFTVGDAETAPGSLTVSGSSSNTVLVPNAALVFGGSGSGRTVIVTPAPNQSGTATITLTVSDGTMTAASTFLLTVSAVNDAPTIATVAGQTINENSATGALALAVGDAETAATSLIVSATSSNTTLVPSAAIVFGGSGANRSVTVTPAPNQSGTATITLTVTDGTSVATSSFVLTVSASETPGLLEIVALSGDEAPGAGGARFSAFASDLRSDGDGDSAFLGTLNSASSSAKGIWAETDGILDLVARQGSAAPGVPAAVFDAFATSPRVTGSGHLLLYSKLLAGPGGVTTANDNCLWYKSPSGPLQLVVREDAQAAGLAAGAKYLQLGSNTVLGADGLHAFTATLKTNSSLGITSANDSGLWTNFSGPLALLAREGAAAPGTTNGVQFYSFTTALISANSSGQIAFRTELKATTGVSTANKYGIWMWDGTQLAKIVRGGELAPGTPTGAVFSLPGAPLLRDAMLLFYSTLATTGGVTKSNDTGIWILENGTVSLVAREGTAAPGAPSGAVFNVLPVTLTGNDRGDFIFKAALRTGGAITSSNSDGIWARSPATSNGLTLIAREGAQAPQTPAGAVFSTFDAAIVSGGGREAFTANLLAGKGGVTTANDRGLWMRSSAGQFELVLREGASIPVSATDIRTVANITLDKSSESGAAGFSDANSIKILVAFTNGSSAIMSYAAP